LHVLVYYGVSDSTRNPTRRKLNEEQLQLVFDYGKSLGAVPVIISLDLNQDPSSCGPLCDAINSSFWTDLAIPKASSRDREPLATYVEQKWKRDEYEVKSGQTRIDLMVVNEVAKFAVKDFREMHEVAFDFRPGTYPHHVPLRLELNLDTFKQSGYRLHLCPPLVLDKINKGKERVSGQGRSQVDHQEINSERARAFDQAHAELKEQLQGTLIDGDVDARFKLINKIAFKYLVNLGAQCKDRHLDMQWSVEDPRLPGRGEMPRRSVSEMQQSNFLYI